MKKVSLSLMVILVFTTFVYSENVTRKTYTEIPKQYCKKYKIIKTSTNGGRSWLDQAEDLNSVEIKPNVFDIGAQTTYINQCEVYKGNGKTVLVLKNTVYNTQILIQYEAGYIQVIKFLYDPSNGGNLYEYARAICIPVK